MARRTIEAIKTIDAMVTRCRRRYLCDILIALAAAAGVHWYATLMPPGALATSFSVIGWLFVGCAGLAAISGALDMAAVAIGRSSRSRWT